MKKIIVLLLSVVSLSSRAQKDIVLPQDSTKRTWDFFKYFDFPTAGDLNQAVEVESCFKLGSQNYAQALNSFEALWTDFNNGPKSQKKIKSSEKAIVAKCKTIATNYALSPGVTNLSTDKRYKVKYFFDLKGFKAYTGKCKLLYPQNTEIAEYDNTVGGIFSDLIKNEEFKKMEDQSKNAPSQSGMLTVNKKAPRGNDALEFQNAKGVIDEPFIFEKGALQVSGNGSRKSYEEGIIKSDAVIKEYDEAVTKFLATNPSGSILKTYLGRLKSKAEAVNSAIKQTANGYEKEVGLYPTGSLQELYLYKGFLQSISRVYTETQTFKDNLKTVEAAIASYGSREKFMDHMEEKYKNWVKNLKMIPAQQSNPKIEALIKKDYEAIFKEFTVTKVNLTYKIWIIEKNDLDIPTHRYMGACIAVKNAKGECGLASMSIREEYSGGGNFGETYTYLPTDPIIVSCENIK